MTRSQPYTVSKFAKASTLRRQAMVLVVGWERVTRAKSKWSVEFLYDYKTIGNRTIAIVKMAMQIRASRPAKQFP